ncbi:Septum formation protein Maf [uncultured archaeon]|nr:Septum formation protein Maf [uncultured archaeon]
MVKQKIILASTSPRRKELAQQMGLDFEIVPSSYEEDMTLDLSPKELAKTLAYGKAKDVAGKFDEGIVIGIDTFVVFNGKKLGKPKSKQQAIDMLKSFSGKSQEVYSGIALIDCKTKKEIKDFEVTTLKFRKMNDEEIKKYVETGEPMDKAGAYAVQGLSSIFIEKVNGCYQNIVGFPIHKIYQSLTKLGVDIFEYERWQAK